jgi:sialate O-acetylesterase
MIEFALSALFNDHMVLQRQRTNPVWGWDRPQQTITLRVERPPSTEPIVSPVNVVAGPDGSWRIDCPELPAGGPYRVRLKGSSERTIEDVLVGEVWLASGQSNMEWNLSATDGAEAEIAAANLPQIRQAYVQHAATSEPQRNAQASWRVARQSPPASFLRSVITSLANSTSDSACPWASSTLPGAERASRPGRASKHSGR